MSTKCVANQTLALLLIKASDIAKAIPNPSLVLVPRPSSSMTAMLSASTFLSSCQSSSSKRYPRQHHLRINAISRISTENVDKLASMLSSVVVRANTLWMMGNAA